MNFERTAYFRYRRRFKTPLRTGAGIFTEREGIVLRIDTGTAIGYGEIAPWHGFAGERLDDVEHFLREHVAAGGDAPVPPELPLLRGAFSMATEMLRSPIHTPTTLRSAILITPENVKNVFANLTPEQRDAPEPLVFKLKISPNAPAPAEVAALLDALPHRAKLRLDANGAFAGTGAFAPWLKILADERVDFLEQPFAPSPADAAGEPPCAVPADLLHKIALDESVSLANSLPDAPYGPLVVKPLLLGDRERFRAWLREHSSARIIYSSCFETAFGREFALNFAAGNRPQNAATETHGFGTLGAFAPDDLEAHRPAGNLAISLGWLPEDPKTPSLWEDIFWHNFL